MRTYYYIIQYTYLLCIICTRNLSGTINYNIFFLTYFHWSHVVVFILLKVGNRKLTSLITKRKKCFSRIYAAGGKIYIGFFTFFFRFIIFLPSIDCSVTIEIYLFQFKPQFFTITYKASVSFNLILIFDASKYSK